VLSVIVNLSYLFFSFISKPVLHSNIRVKTSSIRRSDSRRIFSWIRAPASASLNLKKHNSGVDARNIRGNRENAVCFITFTVEGKHWLQFWFPCNARRGSSRSHGKQIDSCYFPLSIFYKLAPYCFRYCVLNKFIYAREKSHIEFLTNWLLDW